MKAYWADWGRAIRAYPGRFIQLCFLSSAIGFAVAFALVF